MGANGLKIWIDVFENNSLVNSITYVLDDGEHKEDPIEILRDISYGIKDKKINKLKTNWYWNKQGKHLKTPKRIVFGFKK